MALLDTVVVAVALLYTVVVVVALLDTVVVVVVVALPYLVVVLVAETVAVVWFESWRWYLDLTYGVNFKPFLLAKVFRFFSWGTIYVWLPVCNEEHNSFAICSSKRYNHLPDFFQSKSRSSSASNVVYFANSVNGFYQRVHFSISQVELDLSFSAKGHNSYSSSGSPAISYRKGIIDTISAIDWYWKSVLISKWPGEKYYSLIVYRLVSKNN